MAQFENTSGKNSKMRMNKKNVRIDLTPMVDLGFLLITFFILTTSLTTPTVANLTLPKDSDINMPISASFVLTVILQKNNEVDYYEGMPEGFPEVHHSVFANIRSVIQQKQKEILAKTGDRLNTILVIKPSAESSYKNLIDILDEVMINNVTHYFVADINPMDKAVLQKNNR